jgi:hypothetical protein
MIKKRRPSAYYGRACKYWHEIMGYSMASTFLPHYQVGTICRPRAAVRHPAQVKVCPRHGAHIEGTSQSHSAGDQVYQPTRQNTRYTTKLTSPMDPGVIHICLLRDQEQIKMNLTAMLHDRYIMVTYCAKKSYIYFNASNAHRKGNVLAAF